MADPKQLDSLSIRRFRGLEHVEFPKLGRVNLIVGKNDAGKTSVLEAVFLAAGIAVPPLPVAFQNQRRDSMADSHDLLLLFHDLRVDKRMEFTSITPVDHRQLTISADCDGPALSSSKLDVPHALRYTAEIRSHSSSPSQHYAGTLAVADGEVKLTDNPGCAPIREEAIPTRLLMPSTAYDDRIIAEVMIGEKQDELIKCIRAVNNQVKSVAVSGDTAYVDIGMDRMVPVSMCGDGLVRAAQALSSCLLGDVSILLIDEIGNGLHYTALEPVLTAIMTMCEQQGIQVFLTTHSLEVLQSLQHVLSNGLSHLQPETECYALARDRNGMVRAYRYDYEQFDHAISRRIEIR